VTDWIGRSVATITQWPKNGLKTEMFLLIAVSVRAGFIPLIMRCNVAPLNRNTNIWFSSDLSYSFLLGIFSFTGGHIGNVAMMLGPKKIDVELQEVAGTLNILALVMGAMLGSFLGPYFVRML